MSAQHGKNQNLGLRKRRKKPGDLAQLRRVLWGALLEVEAILETGDNDEKLRAAHALGTLAGSYLKATETSDLERRLAEVEGQLAIRKAA